MPFPTPDTPHSALPTPHSDHHPPLHAHPARREARILAMQALCCLDAQGDDALPVVDTLFAESEATADVRVRARTLVEAARARRDDFEADLKATVPAWDVARITLVDRNVLRVAAAELALADTPPRVILNEAIEIAREYGSAESPAFVNGVLDAIYKR